MKRIPFRQGVTGTRGGRASRRAVRLPVDESSAAQQESFDGAQESLRPPARLTIPGVPLEPACPQAVRLTTPGVRTGVGARRLQRSSLFGVVVAAGTLLLGITPLHAQNFDSGSNGSDGAFTMSQSTTLDVPPDGIFNFTTVTMTGGNLTFRRNALNTPVFILATGDITISNANALVDGADGTSNPPAGGAGGPGGFDGGDPGVQSIPPGHGHGPGGGAGGDANAGGTANTSAGAAAYGSVSSQPSASDGAVYGSPLLIPIVGGSGGGGGVGSGTSPGVGGAGGGGAILMASNTRIQINAGGGVFARGANNSFPHTGTGSGGAIRLVAPVVAGNATLNVSGGASSGANDTRTDVAGHGRIRIDTIDRTGIRFNFAPLAAFSIGSFMAVFPPVVPKLAITNVAGQAIAAGSPVDVILPFGTNPNQPVTVQATDFTGTVPIEVVLVPASGERSVVRTQINATTSPAQTTVNVTFPVNNRTRVWAWTR
jgi:hypothetical protein